MLFLGIVVRVSTCGKERQGKKDMPVPVKPQQVCSLGGVGGGICRMLIPCADLLAVCDPGKLGNLDVEVPATGSLCGGNLWLWKLVKTRGCGAKQGSTHLVLAFGRWRQVDLSLRPAWSYRWRVNQDYIERPV